MSTAPRSMHTALSHAGDELMTLKAVADLVRVPEATLRYLRHLGIGLHGFRIGRSARFWRNNVIHWLDEQSR